ncbi:hypothetical protein AWI34_03880 [Enterobacter roggenkampii]|nr:hypothetical protein AWI34_03880 [Enterobacter roggenkampii]
MAFKNRWWIGFERLCREFARKEQNKKKQKKARVEGAYKKGLLAISTDRPGADTPMISIARVKQSITIVVKTDNHQA